MLYNRHRDRLWVDIFLEPGDLDRPLSWWNVSFERYFCWIFMRTAKISFEKIVDLDLLTAIYNFTFTCRRCCFCSFHIACSLWQLRIRFWTINTFTHTHTHTPVWRHFVRDYPGWAGTRKVKPISILLKQEALSGSGVSWAICKSAPRSRQITTPAPHYSDFYRLDALPVAQPTASKHWRDISTFSQQEIVAALLCDVVV